MKIQVTCLGALALLVSATHARADVSSWVYVGGGVTSVEQKRLDRHAAATLAVEAGVGTPPTGPLVVGGMFKLLTLFGDGADLGLAVRFANRSFVTGGFGLALDAGAYQRFWGAGSTGGQGALVFGAPWGITLSVNGGIGSKDARMLGATLGLDFARLTVYRLAGENWFPNPRPAFRPER